MKQRSQAGKKKEGTINIPIKDCKYGRMETSECVPSLADNQLFFKKKKDKIWQHADSVDPLGPVQTVMERPAIWARHPVFYGVVKSIYGS